MHAYVEIIRADGRTETYPLEGEQVTVGSGLDAGIPIADASELEPVHLLLAPRGEEGCWVAVVQDAEALAWVGGKKHENGVLEWGTEIDVGSITLRINHAIVEERKRRAQRRRWAIIGLLVVALALFSLISRDARGGLPRRPADPPALFDDLPTSCPEEDRGRAAARAESARDEADARVIRYPFDAQDGVTAVRLLTTAAVCMTATGDEQEAAFLIEERDRIKAQLEEDYQLHQVRLERMLRQHRRAEALAEARALLALLEHRAGPYRDWLVRVKRHIEIKLEGKRSRR